MIQACDDAIGTDKNVRLKSKVLIACLLIKLDTENDKKFISIKCIIETYLKLNRLYILTQNYQIPPMPI